jgi:xanthine dehydrogenase molybdenum-binding subunit
MSTGNASAKKKYKVIGTRPIRHDGADKVTGRAKYGGDVRLTGMLFGAILRSPHAHAKIRSIDISAAAALPGVHAIVTGKDIPEPGDRIVELGEGSVNMRHLATNVLADDKVLYRGHAVAAVAADSADIAAEAILKIVVNYEKLPPVIDVREAMKPGAPLLHNNIFTKEMGSPITDKPSNVAAKFYYEQGDADAAFKKADVVIEREFQTATVHQGYIEPHTSTAQWHMDGRLTVWTSTQGSFSVRQQVAELLEMPQSLVRVVPMEIGGGFGGKITVYEAPVAALLSKKTGRPVKITMNRADVFQGSGPTPGSYMKVKLGADKTGKLVAGEAYIAFEAGAYPGSPVNPAAMCVFSCYDIPNAKVTGYDVCVNKPRSNAYRAPGSTQAAFAVETVLEEVAEKLGVCPLEIRLKNAVKEGTRRVDGPVYPRIGMVECLEAIKNSDHWKSKLTGPNRGRGLAVGYWFNAGLKSSVNVSVNLDGKVTLVEGSTDIGGSRAGLAMQLAETLGITAQDVVPLVADTDNVGYTDVTGGSRVTYATGKAVYEAGLKVIDLLVDRAALIWEVDATQVRYEDGAVHGPGGKSMTFKELAAKLHESGEGITATASVNPHSAGGAFAVHLVDVEVDPDTGKTQIVRYTAAQDVGTAIHPAYVEGQMQGGAVQGIGWALNEEYFYDAEGTMRNSSYLDYRIPTCFDIPNIETIMVEVPEPTHPFGVRGVGEAPICPPPAAIGAAIYKAAGVRMLSLPMSPPKVLHEILKK